LVYEADATTVRAWLTAQPEATAAPQLPLESMRQLSNYVMRRVAIDPDAKDLFDHARVVRDVVDGQPAADAAPPIPWTDDEISEVIDRYHMLGDTLDADEGMRMVRDDLVAHFGAAPQEASAPQQWQPVDTDDHDLEIDDLIVSHAARALFVRGKPEPIAILPADLAVCRLVAPAPVPPVALDAPNGPGWWAFEGEGGMFRQECKIVAEVYGNLFNSLRIRYNDTVYEPDKFIGTWTRLPLPWERRQQTGGAVE
jgi:hypothetical protein